MEKYLQQTKSDCIKVVLFGPESTGKSTLAKELAIHFKTDFIEEYAREYLQKKYEFNISTFSNFNILVINSFNEGIYCLGYFSE